MTNYVIVFILDLFSDKVEVLLITFSMLAGLTKLLLFLSSRIVTNLDSSLSSNTIFSLKY
jgi:hypothetical protein